MATGKTCILALDQGTTSSRAILFDAAGMPIGVAQEEFPQHAREQRGPDGEDLGVVEHDPEDIWRTQLTCARRVLAETGTAAADVAAVGITNQRETTILWDRETGRPVAPAIVWRRRSAAGSRRPASARRFAAARACCSTRISRPPRSSTCWRRFPASATAAAAGRSCSARSTRS
jgi:glycerol kinase